MGRPDRPFLGIPVITGGDLASPVGTTAPVNATGLVASLLYLVMFPSCASGAGPVRSDMDK